MGNVIGNLLGALLGAVGSVVHQVEGVLHTVEQIITGLG